ncbi:flavin monoamine oxidase family protein [Paraburkholderia diazotrophica]|uniref:NAD(P)-binding Rossmann-like domain-containing protein n=1 Tax=Paraburkholderia diazotrophica TaxID=667676 RepID=A0A1H7ETR8_9BURK|nr:FAD-dependent oxidoreductase [Paraburkholderia diazotrophica]SEK14165.1 NAD(P)-binding Rossmann-like domain-containing protein [Paraburkholderia diazotrophica]
MSTAHIAIIGGGLSGLYAAFLLEQHGLKDYVLLEARHTFGGRIESVPANGLMVAGTGSATADHHRFDLGPAWFWPALQSQLDRLVRDLGLERFEQHEAGDVMVEHSPNEPPARIRGYASSLASVRLVGGMAALIDAVHSRLAPARLMTGHQVRRLRCTGHHVELDIEGARGQVASLRVGHVLLAVPPRLAVATIEFTPALPETLERAWRRTATWMAPHAKYVAVYDTPFWREQGLSGEARSARGPLGEIHDASAPGGSAALFGFFGVPPRVRRNVSDDVLRSHCRAQLTRLFGARAATPTADFIKDWAAEPYTATAADQDAVVQHSAVPSAEASSGVWHGRLVGVGSEWSPHFPGYVAGAIEAASLGVCALKVAATREDLVCGGRNTTGS